MADSTEREPMPTSQWVDVTSRGARGLLYIPDPVANARAGVEADPAELVVVFHGAGQTPRGLVESLKGPMTGRRLAFLLPKSTGQTWDGIRGPLGPDLSVLSSLLGAALAQPGIAEKPLTLAGFSDGASYALGVGQAFGTQFDRVIAFSPGFVVPIGDPVGTPAFYISHGTRDGVLPIDRTSRRIVPELREQRYPVRYVEFDGPHSMPPEIVGAAFDWLAEMEVDPPPAGPVRRHEFPDS